jgi:hypothetical protein
LSGTITESFTKDSTSVIGVESQEGDQWAEKGRGFIYKPVVFLCLNSFFLNSFFSKYLTWNPKYLAYKWGYEPFTFYMTPEILLQETQGSPE